MKHILCLTLPAYFGFNSILNYYEIPLKEINNVKKILSKNNNLNKLKNNQVIKFTVELNDSKKIINFLYPVSRTKKIKIVRNIKNKLKRFFVMMW